MVKGDLIVRRETKDSKCDPLLDVDKVELSSAAIMTRSKTKTSERARLATCFLFVDADSFLD